MEPSEETSQAEAGWWVLYSLAIKAIAPTLGFVWLDWKRGLILALLFLVGNVIGSLATEKVVSAQLQKHLKEINSKWKFPER
jgi:hypothetical protein